MPTCIGSRLAAVEFQSAEPEAATLDYALVFQQAAIGEPSAIALRDHSLKVWSALAVDLVHAYDPEVLVLGGGLMASAEVVVPAIDQYMVQHAISPWGTVHVLPAELGSLAAMVAGEWLLNDQYPNHKNADCSR